MWKAPFLWISMAVVPMLASADPAKVVDVTSKSADDSWTFSVTILHPEKGWDDYADGWRVVLQDGTILGERPLAHPHANEQPFTRSLSGVVVPEGIKTVYIETRTSVTGWDSERFAHNLQ